MAHFYSACGETALNDSLLIRQFVQSLKGAAFTWYTQLQPGSLHTWDDLQRAFLAQFVSSKRRVSIIDLAHTHQRPNESVNDFIMRWRSLSLQCPEKLSEQSAVQMCANNLDPQVATYVGTAEPQNFDALVSKASNVERQLARQKAIQPKREEIKRPNKKGESMATFVRASPKPINGGNLNKGKDKQKERARRLTLQERKEKKYPFDVDDAQGIFDELMAAKPFLFQSQNDLPRSI